jgi:hypothetical protein
MKMTSRRMRWAGHVARMEKAEEEEEEEEENAYRILVGNAEGKRPPERPQ